MTTCIPIKRTFQSVHPWMTGLRYMNGDDATCTSWAFSFTACLTDECCPGPLLQSHVLENQEERQGVTRHDVSASLHHQRLFPATTAVVQGKDAATYCLEPALPGRQSIRNKCDIRNTRLFLPSGHCSNT